MALKIKVLSNIDALAQEAALIIASIARESIIARNCFTLAVSGGKTPWTMLRYLSHENLPWSCIHIFQIDERIAPEGDPNRNLVHLHQSLLEHTPIPRDNIHAMAVNATNLVEATRLYEQELQKISGNPPILDIAHLGLGSDGHTASLIPHDPVLSIMDRDIALTDPVRLYENYRRMTMTYPMINRSRHILWLVIGATKTSMILKLKESDPSIPGGRISQENALLLTDIASVSEARTNHP